MVATECDTRMRLDLFYMSHGDGPDVFTSFPDPENCSIEELEQVLDYCCPDHKSFRRLNAIHSLVIGTPFGLVVRNTRVSERIRFWVSRFNVRRIDGLIHHPGAGKPRILGR